MGKSSVLDVAKYILQRRAPESITTWKLQKLVYYCQAWSLVWDEEPLFGERLLAWANGPVVEELYRAHKGEFKVGAGDFHEGHIENLTDNQKDTIKKTQSTMY